MDPSTCLICSVSRPELHRFPRNKERLIQWLTAIKRTDLLEGEHSCSIVYNSGRLCRAHFDEKFYCGKDKNKLSKHAVPKLSGNIKKSTTSKNTQEYNVIQGDNNAVSEKRSCVTRKSLRNSPIKKELEEEFPSSKPDTVNEEKSLRNSSTKKELEEKLPSTKPDIVNEEKSLRNSSTKKELEEEFPSSKPDTVKEENLNAVVITKEIIQENIHNAINSKKEPERIIGATNTTGELLLLVKWKDVNEAEILPATFARKQFPELLIQFYEERLVWTSYSEKSVTNAS